MRRRLLFIGLTLCAMCGPAIAQAQVNVLREACVDTGMRREAYDEYAAEQNWQSSIRVVRAGDPRINEIWERLFRDDAAGAQFWMTGETAGADSAHATSCGVADTRPAQSWRSDLEALALELGMQPMAAEPGERSLEAGAWSGTGAEALSLSFDRYPSGVTVRLTRPATALDN